MLEQRQLARKAPGEASQVAIRPDHAVARHDDADGVAAHGAADGPCASPRLAHALGGFFGQIAVGAHLAERYLAQQLPHDQLERGADGGERKPLDVGPPTGEILVEPGAGRLQAPRASTAPIMGV